MNAETVCICRIDGAVDAEPTHLRAMGTDVVESNDSASPMRRSNLCDVSGAFSSVLSHGILQF